MDTTNKTHARNHGLRKIYKKPGAIALTGIIILLGAALAIYFLLPKGERINGSGYQVVYMTSGQAYFGKLQNVSGEYMVLRNPYTAQNVQPQENDDQEASSDAGTTLLQVSRQQYGPEDTMSLKSDQVLFWQNLRSDSKVAEAIKNQASQD